MNVFLDGATSQLLGVALPEGFDVGLIEVARGGGMFGSQIGVGEPERVAVPLGEGESIACVQSGLWLVARDDERLAIMLKSKDRGMGEQLTLEVMSPDTSRAETVVAELWRLMAERNVYRGRVLELRERYFHDDEGAPLTVRTLPAIARATAAASRHLRAARRGRSRSSRAPSAGRARSAAR
jgi:hypothetical protein